jgi:hypothetical protein
MAPGTQVFMARLFGSRPYYLVCALATSLGVGLAMQIALVTRYDAHPDEYLHVDAFCYFQSNAWMPPPDVDGLEHGPEGHSRVYDGEIVYWVYGRASSLTQQSRPLDTAPPTLSVDLSQCLPHYTVYRLFNVALFLLTLGILFAVGARHAWAAAIGMLMLCLPQVIYLYAYANSDAWALSFALFLLVFALAEERPLGSAWKAALLGLLAGVVLLSKSTVWIALPLAGALIGYPLVRDWRQSGSRPPALWRHAAIVAVTTLLLLAPIRIVYPLAQGPDFEARMAAMRERRAQPGYKPSNPYAPGRELRSNGVGLEQIVFNLAWMKATARSFYGYFGYMTFQSPRWAAGLAAALGTFNVLLTLVVHWRRWKDLPGPLRLVLVSAPVVIAALVLASMLNSWIREYQPQGRYLFVAIFPIALWMWGILPWESGRIRAVRLASAAILLALSAFVLWRIVLENPTLRL